MASRARKIECPEELGRRPEKLRCRGAAVGRLTIDVRPN